MHAKAWDAVPLRMIARNQCVFSTGNLPSTLNNKEPTVNLVRTNSLPTFYFLKVISQPAANAGRSQGLSNIHRNRVATTIKSVHATEGRRFRIRQWVGGASFKGLYELVCVTLVHVKLELVQIAH